MVFELAAAGMEIPPVIDGPQVFLGQHAAQAFHRRNRRARAGLGIEAIGPAAAAWIAVVTAVNLSSVQ